MRLESSQLHPDAPTPSPDVQSRGGWVGKLGLAVLATALSLYAASVIYDDWRMSDAVTVEEAFEEHRVSFPDFQPNVPVEVLSFPVTDRFEDVPRFSVLLNDWGLRERPFEREPAAGVRRIMAVGESSTFGTGLATGERFTELLDEHLEQDHY